MLRRLNGFVGWMFGKKLRFCDSLVVQVVVLSVQFRFRQDVHRIFGGGIDRLCAWGVRVLFGERLLPQNGFGLNESVLQPLTVKVFLVVHHLVDHLIHSIHRLNIRRVFRIVIFLTNWISCHEWFTVWNVLDIRIDAACSIWQALDSAILVVDVVVRQVDANQTMARVWAMVEAVAVTGVTRAQCFPGFTLRCLSGLANLIDEVSYKRSTLCCGCLVVVRWPLVLGGYWCILGLLWLVQGPQDRLELHTLLAWRLRVEAPGRLLRLSWGWIDQRVVRWLLIAFVLL